VQVTGEFEEGNWCLSGRLFAGDLDRDPESMEDLTTVPTSGDTQSTDETQPKPQVAPASFNNNMTIENVEDYIMVDEEEDGTILRVLDGVDHEACTTCIGVLFSDKDQQRGAPPSRRSPA
jgi:hypothetical protein